MTGPILIETESYDENSQQFDEPYSPVEARNLFEDYLNIAKRSFLNERKLHSYFLQCKTIADLPDVEKILEIGPGGGITQTLLKSIGYDYATMDAQPLIEPDILGDFIDFNTSGYEESFDLVAAFQMLEHTPYEQFVPQVQKMITMSKKYVFISLPYHCWTLRLEIILPVPQWIASILSKRWFNFLRRSHNFSTSRPYRNAPARKYRRAFFEEFPLAIHHWEIGRDKVSKKDVFQKLKSVNLSVVKAFHSKIHPYHYFILCKRVNR
jgi:hypothetical protein